LTDLNLDRIEAALPTERQVLFAAAAAPLSFMAVHGMSAASYIRKLRELRTLVAELRAEQNGGQAPADRAWQGLF